MLGGLSQGLIADGGSEPIQPLPGIRAGHLLGDRIWKIDRLVGGAQERAVARAAARAQRYLVETGPAGHVGGAHVRLPGQIRQGSPVFDVLLKQPVPVDDASALVVLGTFAQLNAVLGSQPPQGLPGEAGLSCDVVQRLVPVNVAAAELLLGERLARRAPNLAGGAGLGCGERCSGYRVFIEDDADRIDGGTEDFGRVLDRESSPLNEALQASYVDKGRVWPWEVEIAEKTERRVPGDRFASDPVPGEEVTGDLVECRGEFRRPGSGEAGCFGAEVGFVGRSEIGRGFDRKPADACEEYAACDLVPASLARQRAYAAAQGEPLLSGSRSE